METRSRVVSALGATLAALFVFVSSVRAQPEKADVPMSLKPMVSFGLSTEQWSESATGKYKKPWVDTASNGLKLQRFDAPGPGYFRQVSWFDQLKTEFK